MYLIKPIITEQTLAESAKNKYAFAVRPGVTKDEIKKTVEKLFQVRVLGVQTINVAGKSFRTGKRWVFRQKPDWKKAIVTTEKGKTIDLFEITKQG